jgi:hypothetical protein
VPNRREAKSPGRQPPHLDLGIAVERVEVAAVTVTANVAASDAPCIDQLPIGHLVILLVGAGPKAKEIGKIIVEQNVDIRGELGVVCCLDGHAPKDLVVVLNVPNRNGEYLANPLEVNLNPLLAGGNLHHGVVARPFVAIGNLKERP